MSNLQATIEKLIKSKAINIETKQSKKIRYRGSKIFCFKENEEPLLHDFCRCIVVGKDETKKKLILHLTYILEDGKSIFINHMKYTGYIYDYDLKQEFSIFTYIGNFKQISIGTQIVAQVRNKGFINQKIFFELTLKYKVSQEKQRELRKYFCPGITKDNVQISTKQWKKFEKYGYFSSLFLAQYQEDFQNPGLFHQLCKDLRIYQDRSLDANSLLGPLENLSLDFQRLIFDMKQIRLRQQKQWADQHFMEGLNQLKAHRPETALQHLNLAKSFEKKNTKIMIARGCALANLNNFTEGLKQMREVLSLSPDNKQAHKYIQKIKIEMKAANDNLQQQNGQRIKKIRLNNSYEANRK